MALLVLGTGGGVEVRYWDVEVWERGMGIAGGVVDRGVQKALERGERRVRRRKRGMEQRIVSRIR